MNEETYLFKIESQQRVKNGYVTTAFASGSIQYDEGLERTIMQGTARFSVWNYLVWLGLVVFIMMLLFGNVFSSSGEAVILFALIAVVLVLTLWQMFRDRNRIVHELEQNVDYIQAEKYVEEKAARSKHFDWQEEMKQRYTGTSSRDHYTR